MPTQRLVIDGNDRGHFFLSVQDGTLTIGPDPAQADLVLANLHVVRLHCEVEVEDAAVVVGADSSAPGAPPRGRALKLGQALHVGRSHISLVAASAAGAAPVDADDAIVEPEPETPAESAGPPKWLVVIDGADRGRRFLLNSTGRTSIGKSPRHADVVLHDFYVARVHCELMVDGDQLIATHVEGQGGTLVNGKLITRQELLVGDVLRVGNSFLRYHLSVGDAPPDTETVDDLNAAAALASPNLPEGLGNRTSASMPSAIIGGGKPASPPSILVDPLLKLPGQPFGHYQIETLLGRGQSGAVFRALDNKTNQPVTLKVLAPEFPANEPEAQAFVRAIKLVAPLRHSQLVTIYAAGKTGPFCWIAREHVEGESLQALIERLTKEGRLGWKRACRVAVHLGQVLDFLHRHQAVHGNLTPTNVVIATGSKVAKLADLMLDRALAGSRLEATIKERKQLAELAYWSPEQLDRGAAPDHCSSIYALGAMIYALLTGRPPLTGASPSELIRQLDEERIVRPSKHLRETPAPFEAAVMKMLARRREDRYQSAAEMLIDIEPIASMHEIQ
jgi:Protein kinase domain/Inner membrane component of T3SS, cytoplasmic domain